MKYFFKLITRHIIVIWIVVLIYNIFANTLFWREYEIVPFTYKDVTMTVTCYNNDDTVKVETAYFKYKDNSFQNEVNVILKDVGYQLKDGKIMYLGLDVYAETPIEPNLKDMIQIAETYRKKYDEDSMQAALEKIWDVFESLKTYYGTDKKRSMSKIISLISPTDTDLNKQIDEECKLLTNIGNTYKIRHFEKGKLEIPDIRIKEYFYIRCLAMINLILKYVESK